MKKLTLQELLAYNWWKKKNSIEKRILIAELLPFSNPIREYMYKCMPGEVTIEEMLWLYENHHKII